MASLRSLLSNISSVIRLNAFFVCNKYVPSKLVTNTIRVNQGRFNIHTTAGLCHGEYERLPPKSQDEVVNIKIYDRDGIGFDIKGKVGDNLMMLAQLHDVDVEGACEASLACCTCHVYVQEEYFEKLDEADIKEEDLLDMAPFLSETSRLSCQIILRKDLNGMVVRLPMATRNMRVDQK